MFSKLIVLELPPFFRLRTFETHTGEDVHNINVLTVIANESYESFAEALQSEMAEAVGDRPVRVTIELFKNKVIKDSHGNEQVVDSEMAQVIYDSLVEEGYVKRGQLTDKYYEDKKTNKVVFAEEIADSAEGVINILDMIYDSALMMPENARQNTVELKVDKSKLGMPEFKKLWNKINRQSVYVVDFDTDELIRKSVAALNTNLRVTRIYFKVETGSIEEIKSKEELLSGESFVQEKSSTYHAEISSDSGVKYDLIGKIVSETGLTRAAVVKILQGIDKNVFDQFKENPEEFILKASHLINEQKATVIIQHISYNKLESVYDTDIFTEPTMKGRLDVNAMPAKRHLYDYILYDSNPEREFATKLDASSEVAVYVKLPKGFYINTPVGKYNPDWAIAFNEGAVKHIYFVAETKGSMSTMQLRAIETAKIHCAREHFRAISTDDVKYDVIDSYEALLDKVMR